VDAPRSDATGLHADPITLWGLVVGVHTTINGRLDTELQDRLVNPLTWFEVLLRLARAEDERMTMTRLAESVSFSSGGFSRVADRLVAAGLLERLPCPGNRRATLAHLTDHGRRTLDSALAVHADGIQRLVLAHLDEAQAAALRDALAVLWRAHRPERARPAPPEPRPD
jgi:DNA-binding MarR family transcriptional regulator